MATKAYEYSMVMVETPFNTQKWDVNGKEDSRIKRSLTTTAKASLCIAVVIVAMIVIVVVVIFAVPGSDVSATYWPSYTSDSKLGVYKMAALSTDAAPCAPIGKNILERNGTAMDAAIAVLACMGAHNPHSMGLGGGFLMIFYNRSEQRAYFMDAREVAPRNSKVDMFQGNAFMSRDGGLAIAVPGELAGYAEAHRQFGGLPWKDLFTPTIKMCKRGIEVSAHLARAIRNNREALMDHGAIGQVFLKNGTDIYKQGEYIKMPDLARTLEIIANQGMEALYGPSKLADQFLQDLKNAGSIIDKLDIQDYSPRMREPVKVSLRNGTTLYSVSVPGSGPLLGFMMSLLDGYPDINASVSKNMASTVLTYHRMIEAFKYAYAHRNQLEDDDSDEIENLLKKLASPQHADFVRSHISDTRTYEVSHYGVNFSFVEDHGTAHLSLLAPNGDAVAVTSTINTYFGSKVLSPSTGIVLNNEMDDFSSPNITNYFELPPSTKNRIRPGKRPMSSMSPAIVVDSQGDVKLVVGGNGGTMITTGVLQVMARVLIFEEDIKQAIDAPRIHHQLTPNIVHYEKEFPGALIDKLSELGHKLNPWTMGMMSIIMGIARGDDGYLYANSDYRKGGDVQGF